MKSIQNWLDEYGVSHTHPTNKTIHWICVPLIFFSITGLLYSVEIPTDIYNGIRVNLAHIMLFAVTIYYATLSRTLWIGMLLFGLLCVAACYAIVSSGLPLWLVCVVIFVLAWIGQFYGHKLEGKKPSFLKDLQFLMIGPAWLMSFIYQRLGISL